jgi:hypothetical protein
MTSGAVLIFVALEVGVTAPSVSMTVSTMATRAMRSDTSKSVGLRIDADELKIPFGRNFLAPLNEPAARRVPLRWICATL